MIDLTPVDVRKKKGDFRRTMRGYDPALVDDFLDQVADRMDELVREVLALNDRVGRQEQQIAEFRERERALTEALVTAQEMREEIRQQTSREAELVKRSAEQQAAQLRSSTQQEVAQLRSSTQQEVAQLRAAAEHEAAQLRRAAEEEASRLRAAAERESAQLNATVRKEREREEEELRRLRLRQEQFLGSYRAFLERELAELSVLTRALSLSGDADSAAPRASGRGDDRAVPSAGGLGAAPPAGHAGAPAEPAEPAAPESDRAAGAGPGAAAAAALGALGALAVAAPAVAEPAPAEAEPPVRSPLVPGSAFGDEPDVTDALAATEAEAEPEFSLDTLPPSSAEAEMFAAPEAPDVGTAPADADVGVAPDGAGYDPTADADALDDLDVFVFDDFETEPPEPFAPEPFEPADASEPEATAGAAPPFDAEPAGFAAFRDAPDATDATDATDAADAADALPDDAFDAPPVRDAIAEAVEDEIASLTADVGPAVSPWGLVDEPAPAAPETALYDAIAEDASQDGVPGPIGLPDSVPDEVEDEDEETNRLLRNAAAAGYQLPDEDELLLDDEILEGEAGEDDGWLPNLLEDER